MRSPVTVGPRQNVFMPIASPAAQNQVPLPRTSTACANTLVSPSHNKWKQQTSPVPPPFMVTSYHQQQVIRYVINYGDFLPSATSVIPITSRQPLFMEDYHTRRLLFLNLIYGHE